MTDTSKTPELPVQGAAITVVVTSPAWCRGAMIQGWSDDESLTQEQVLRCVDRQTLYMVDHAEEIGRGWSFNVTLGCFTGPYMGSGERRDPVEKALTVEGDAVDWIINTMGPDPE